MQPEVIIRMMMKLLPPPPPLPPSPLLLVIIATTEYIQTLNQLFPYMALHISSHLIITTAKDLDSIINSTLEV